jgi:hypothetical protein
MTLGSVASESMIGDIEHHGKEYVVEQSGYVMANRRQRETGKREQKQDMAFQEMPPVTYFLYLTRPHLLVSTASQ